MNPGDTTTLSLVIPCYNEADNLALIIDRINGMTDDFSRLEVILVDNGSTDATQDILERLLPEGRHPHIRKVRVERNQGYGFGILSGLKSARGDYLAWTHADMQTDPADVLAAWSKAANSPHPRRAVVKGQRQGRNPIDALFTFGMTMVASCLLRTHLPDANGQPKLFHRGFYEKMDDAPSDFSLDLYTLYLAETEGFELATIPVRYRERLHGEAKGGGSLRTKWKLTRRTFSYILQLKKKIRDKASR